jgi:superfamily II DNA/RNA helicase
MKFQKPSKIQAISLPMIMTPPYKDLIAQAHNGSGKTTCFVLGMLSRVDPKQQSPQALCICPTRELSIQVGSCVPVLFFPFTIFFNVWFGQSSKIRVRNIKFQIFWGIFV